MQNTNYRYQIKVSKLNELKFISHLDWQSLIIKTFRRMGLKLALSQGFNPTPKISFSPALPLFIESECEFVYFETTSPLSGSENPVFKPEAGEPEGCEKSDGSRGTPRSSEGGQALFDTGHNEQAHKNFAENFKQNISENVKLLGFVNLPYEQKKPQPLETLVQWAQYEAVLQNNYKSIPNFENLKYNIEKCLLSDNLFIKKINKKGFEKNIDYKNSLKAIDLIEMQGDAKIVFTLKAGQGSDIPALRADDFLKEVFGTDVLFQIKRTKFFDGEMNEIK